MSDFNPYAAGTSQIKSVGAPLASGDFPLATLWQRLAGSFVDTVLLLVVMVFFYSAMVLAYGLLFDPTYFESDVARNFREQLLEFAFSFIAITVAFLILNIYLIATRGQTVGKYLSLIHI